MHIANSKEATFKKKSPRTGFVSETIGGSGIRGDTPLKDLQVSKMSEEESPDSDEGVLLKIKSRQIKELEKLRENIPDKKLTKKQSKLDEREQAIDRKLAKYKEKKKLLKEKEASFQKDLVESQLRRLEKLQTQQPLAQQINSLAENTRQLIQVRRNGKKVWGRVIDEANAI